MASLLSTGDNGKKTILIRRMEQLQEWEKSNTNKESSVIKASRRNKVKFGLGTMFLAAVGAADDAEAKRLLKLGVDINYRNNDGLTALHQTCMDDNEEMVNLLIDNNADVDVCDYEGWTPLIAASSLGHVEIARILIDNGADVSKVNVDGETAIDVAEGEEMEELLTKVIEKRGINLKIIRIEEKRQMLEDAQKIKEGKLEDEPDERTGATALHVAAAKGYLEVVKILLDAQVDVNAIDHEGWTPLHAAAHWEQADVCEILVKNGGNFEALTKMKETAKDVAGDSVLDLLDDLEKAYPPRKRQHPKPRESRPDVTQSKVSENVSSEINTSSGSVSTDERNQSEVTRKTTARQRRESRRSTQAVTKEQLAHLMEIRKSNDVNGDTQESKAKPQEDTMKDAKQEIKSETENKIKNESVTRDSKQSLEKRLDNQEEKKKSKDADIIESTTGSKNPAEENQRREISRSKEDKERTTTSEKVTDSTSRLSRYGRDKNVTVEDKTDNNALKSEKSGRDGNKDKEKEEKSSVSSLRSRFTTSDNDSSRKNRSTGKADSNESSFGNARSRFTGGSDTKDNDSVSSFSSIRSRFSSNSSSSDGSDASANRRSRFLADKETVPIRKSKIGSSDGNPGEDTSKRSSTAADTIANRRSRFLAPSTDSNNDQITKGRSSSSDSSSTGIGSARSRFQESDTKEREKDSSSVDRRSKHSAEVNKTTRRSNLDKTRELEDSKDVSKIEPQVESNKNIKGSDEEPNQSKSDFARNRLRTSQADKKTDSKYNDKDVTRELDTNSLKSKAAGNRDKLDDPLEKSKKIENVSVKVPQDANSTDNLEIIRRPRSGSGSKRPSLSTVTEGSAAMQVPSNESLLSPASAEKSSHKTGGDSSSRKRRRSRDKRRATGVVPNTLNLSESEEDSNSEQSAPEISKNADAEISETKLKEIANQDTDLIEKLNSETQRLTDLCQTLEVELNDYKVKLEKMTQKYEDLQTVAAEKERCRRDDKNTYSDLEAKLAIGDRSLKKEKERNREIEKKYQDQKELTKELEKQLQQQKETNKQLMQNSSGGVAIAELEGLRNDNKRLKDENGALIRVISKLSSAR